MGPPTVGGRTKRALPFAFILAIAICAFPIGGNSLSEPWYLAAIAFSLASVGSEILVPWQRMPHQLRIAPLLLALVAIALLRHAAGTNSAYAPMVVIAAVAAAVYGTRWDIGLTVTAGAALLVTPMLLESDTYPSTDWRRVILIVATSILVAAVIKRLVDRLEARSEEAEQRARALDEANERFDEVVQNSPLGMAWVSLDGTITRTNPAFAEMLGRSVGQVVGMNFSELTHPEDRLRDVTAAREILVGGNSHYQTEKRYLRSDGSTVWALLSTTVARDSSGEPQHFFSQIQDITALREANEQAQQNLSNLQRVVATTRPMSSIKSAAQAQGRVCSATQEITDASVVSVWQPTADGRALVSRAAVGADMSQITVPFERSSSGAVWSFRNRKRLFAATAKGHPHVSQRLVDLTGIKSILFEPVMGAEGPIAVLAIGWREHVREIPEQTLSLIELLANEAASMFERADLVLKLDDLAQTDPLTGLPNRRSWEEQLPRELLRSKRNHEDLAVALIDLDQFKEFNDRRGHQAGDRLLREAASAWKAELRATDVICRFGGDEFGLVLPACDAEQAQALMDRLRAATPCGQTCSIGLTEWTRGETAEGLVARADRALYTAKQSGRDKVVGTL